ncbi:MAG: S26 family signal peptidase [Myxococcota bacterium]
MGTGRRLIRPLIRELLSAARGKRRCYRVEGYSMAPSLIPGDVVWTEIGLPGLPTPGDVVVVRDPQERRRILVKRIRSRGAETFSVGSDDPTCGRDSRHFGPLRAGHLIGRALFAWSPRAGLRRLS